MRYRDWTLIMALSGVVTMALIPLMITWLGFPLYHREPGASMSDFRSQVLAWMVLLPFMWGLGILAIWISRRRL